MDAAKSAKNKMNDMQANVKHAWLYNPSGRERGEPEPILAAIRCLNGGNDILEPMVQSIDYLSKKA